MAKVLFIDVASEPELIEFDGSLLSLQSLVGGSIEAFSPIAGETPLLWVNEEGLFRCLPNRAVYATRQMEERGYFSQIDGKPVKTGDLYAILHGPIVAVSYGRDEDDEDFVRDITEDEVTKVMAALGPEGSGEIEAFRIFLEGLLAS